MRIAVVGGGAAGFFAAIRAVSGAVRPTVVLFEASKKPLAKVLISGGGRCNVTNNTTAIEDLIQGYPRGSRELRGPFSRFQVNDTIQWFADRGVVLHTEPDRRMFPVSNNSETIVNCLLHEARTQGVQLRLQTKVTSIEGAEVAGYLLQLSSGEVQHFDAVIIATGGTKGGFQLAQQLGHTIVEPVPSLFTFQVSDARLASLPGVSFEQVHLRLICGENKPLPMTGPMLITHWGLSGPAVIKLSAFAARHLFASNYKAQLQVNFLPQQTAESLLQQLLQHKQLYPKREVGRDCCVPIPKRYWMSVVHQLLFPEKLVWADCTKKQLQLLVSELTAAVFQITGKGVFKEEFVTAGGVLLKEIDFRTMESRVRPRLYFAGEVLDIDGITGGFNFQAAWTTGWIAGDAVSTLS